MNNDAAALLYQQGCRYIDSQTRPVRLGIINAEAHPGLPKLITSSDTYQLQQTHRSEYLALASQEMNACDALNGTFDCILLLPSKQRIQTLGWMACAMQNLTGGGILIACCPNRMGARAYEKRLQELSGNLSSTSKSKCRLFSAGRSKQFNEGLAEEWIQKAATRKLPQLNLYSRPGLFSWDRPDPGSHLLLEHLPPDLSGSGMDLCCGLGYLAAEVLQRSDGIDAFHLVDSERTALDCARLSLKSFNRTRLYFHWLDASAEPLPGNFDWIILNPPFHHGKDPAIELGQKIIAAACGALKTGGRLYLVANVQLPYEATLRKYLKTFQQQKIKDGFKVIWGNR